MKKMDLGTSSETENALDPLKAFSVLLGAIQLAGVVAIVGFMHLYGRETFLGVRSPHVVTDLGFAMGECTLGTILLLLRHTNTSAVGFALICGIGVSITQSQRSHPSATFLNTLRYAITLAALVVALAVVVSIELPVASLNDALASNISDRCESSSQSFLEHRSCGIWYQLKKAHPVAGSVEDTYPQRQIAERALERTYAIGILATTLAWMLLYQSKSGTDSVMRALQMACLTCVLCATLLLPYSFGKLFGWDWTPNVTLHLKKDDKTDERSPEWLTGYLLDASERSIFVMQVQGRATTLVEIPRATVLESDTTNNEDVLAKRLAVTSPVSPTN